MMLAKVDTILVERVRTHMTDAVAPILDVLSRPLDTVNRGVAEIQAMKNLYEENAQLREERTRLMHWKSVAEKLEAENRVLKEQLNVIPEREASFVTARVIADTGGAFSQSVIVNAGARDGVEKGQAAVTADGLVGRAIDVGSRSPGIRAHPQFWLRRNPAVAAALHRCRGAGQGAGTPPMRPTFWQRLDAFARNLTPVALTLVLVILNVVPTHIPGIARVLPVLPLISVFYWSIHRPHLVPAPAVFLIGLFQDGLTGAPMGLHALIFLAVQGVVLFQHKFFMGKSGWLGPGRRCLAGPCCRPFT